MSVVVSGDFFRFRLALPSLLFLSFDRNNNDGRAHVDGSEDDAVWEEEDEETEDAEEIIDNEFETDNEGEEGE